MAETKTTYPCSCTVETVASGTPMAATRRTYCETHNPFKDSSPKVEKINV